MATAPLGAGERAAAQTRSAEPRATINSGGESFCGQYSARDRSLSSVTFVCYEQLDTSHFSKEFPFVSANADSIS